MTTPPDEFVGRMDPEVVSLCRAINLIPGLWTYESCCGHGAHAFRIWVMADSLEPLRHLAYWVDRCHCGHPGWSLVVRTDCGRRPVSFMLEGPVGPEAYEQAEHIASLIRADAEEDFASGRPERHVVEDLLRAAAELRKSGRKDITERDLIELREKVLRGEL